MNNPNTTKEKIKFKINEFHLASLITADRNLGFDKVEKNKTTFLNEIMELIDQVISETRQEVLKQLEEIIPKEIGYFDVAMEITNAKIEGHNSCRAELIKNLSK